MEVLSRKPADIDPNCEVRVGYATWDECDHSVKYASPDKRGHISRNGEIPAAALPQMVRMTVSMGFVSVSAILQAITDAAAERERRDEAALLRRLAKQREEREKRMKADA